MVMLDEAMMIRLAKRLRMSREDLLDLIQMPDCTGCGGTGIGDVVNGVTGRHLLGICPACKGHGHQLSGERAQLEDPLIQLVLKAKKGNVQDGRQEGV